MNASVILAAIALLLVALSFKHRNNPDKAISRKTWLRLAAIFIAVATFNSIMFYL